MAVTSSTGKAEFAEFAESEQWQHLTHLLESVPRDFEAARTTEPSIGTSLFDLLSGANIETGFVSPTNGGLYIAPSMLKPNPGGGDCLLFALTGRELSTAEIIELRANIADVRLTMPENPQQNALFVANALLSTPATALLAAPLMAGRVHISNNIYAALQRIPGIYGGENEVIQWCQLSKKRVLCCYYGLGAVKIEGDSGTQITIDQSLFQEEKDACDLTIYHELGHWRRVI